MIITIPHYPLSSDASKLGQKRKLEPVCCLGETMYGAGWFVVDFILLMRARQNLVEKMCMGVPGKPIKWTQMGSNKTKIYLSNAKAMNFLSQCIKGRHHCSRNPTTLKKAMHLSSASLVPRTMQRSRPSQLEVFKFKSYQIEIWSKVLHRT